MKCLRWMMALLALGLGTTELRAQLFFARGYGVGLARYGYGFGYRHFGRHAALSLSLGGVAVRGYGYGFAPSLYGYGFYGLGPYTSVVNVVTYRPPPIVLMPAPNLLLEGVPLDILPRNQLLDADAAPQVPPAQAQPRPPPEPERVPAPNPDRPPAPRPAPPEKPRPNPPERPPKPPPPGRPPGPLDDPRDENARLIDLGREAFAAFEYGRAAQRFAQATRVAPNEPLAHFLLAQTFFALGKYPEAVDAIHAGLGLNPDWPKVRFRPLELYGRNVADFPHHLQRLEDTLARHPNDPTLLFLYAYELWFDGRRDEARVLFQRALPRFANPPDIQRFLRALPDRPVI